MNANRKDAKAKVEGVVSCEVKYKEDKAKWQPCTCRSGSIGGSGSHKCPAWRGPALKAADVITVEYIDRSSRSASAAAAQAVPVSHALSVWVNGEPYLHREPVWGAGSSVSGQGFVNMDMGFFVYLSAPGDALTVGGMGVGGGCGDWYPGALPMPHAAPLSVPAPASVSDQGAGDAAHSRQLQSTAIERIVIIFPC